MTLRLLRLLLIAPLALSSLRAAPSAPTAAEAAAALPYAGKVTGVVQSIAPDGRFLELRVSSSEPAGFTAASGTARILVTWTKVDGQLRPNPAQTAQFLAYKTGQEVTLPIQEKKGQYRLVSGDKAETVGTPLAPIEPASFDPARVRGAIIDESRVDLVLRLAPDAPADYSGPSDTGPVSSLAAAIGRAKDSLSEGRSVKIALAAGTYKLGPAPIRLDHLPARDPLLVIEGERPGAVVLDGSGFPEKANRSFEINRKHNLVLRNLVLTRFPKAAFTGGVYQPIQDNANWLVEHCDFVANGNLGAALFHVRGLTVRDCRFNENGRTGLFLIARDALVERVQANGNTLGDQEAGSFVGGIALAAQDAILRDIEAIGNRGRGTGIRMDHVAENVLVERARLNDNGKAGAVWETAYGPVLMRYCEIDRNGDRGLSIETVYNFTIEHSTLRDNRRGQIMFAAKPRPINTAIGRNVKTGAYAAGDLARAPGEYWTNFKDMTRTLSGVVMSDCVVTARGAESRLVIHPVGDPAKFAAALASGAIVATGNTYHNPDQPEAFARSKTEFMDFAAWKKFSGVDADSRWAVPAAK